jgi:squalene-associated FAD-dependent desaturase
MTVTPDVIVVGAGFAGLAAAVRLAGAGARVLVVEERRRLGGRATAFPDPQTGELVDNGQHALFGCYHETFAFLRTIGADGNVRLDDRLDVEIVDLAGRRTRLRTADLPAPLHLVAGLLRWPALGAADRVAALRLGLTLRRVASREVRGEMLDPRLDHQTVDEWLRAERQTPRLCQLLWEPLAVAALNQSPATAAAAPFVRVLSRMFSGGRRNAAIGLPNTPLDVLYVDPAVRWLEARGSMVRAGVPARLVVEEGRAVGVRLRQEVVRAGAVVASVPWFAFAGFADGLPALDALARDAAAMTASPIVTVNCWHDRHVTDAPFLGLPGRAFQWVFDKARLFGESASHLSLVSSGADALVGLDNDALIARACDELRDALPTARTARVLRATAVRERRASFSLAPGQPRRPRVRTPVQGLFLAGDWTDTGLPATIEGAVASGHTAAAEVLS